MRRTMAAVMIVLLGLGLVSCTLWRPEPESEAEVATFTVKKASPTKISVDGRASRADKYTWHFDDGTVVEGGPEVAVYSHEYEEPNVYVVRLVVEWKNGAPGNGNGGRGCCGPGPGPGTPGNGRSGEPKVGTAYQIVDLLGEDGVRPILIMWASYGPGDLFYPGDRVCFDLRYSIGDGLIFWVEVVRVVSQADPTPIPYSWADTVEYLRWGDDYRCIYVPGPSCCVGDELWTFRVTVKATDRWGRSSTITKFFQTGWCL